MELKPDIPQPIWSDPVAAYTEYRPGLSPYVHYWFDLNRSRGKMTEQWQQSPTDGADMADQMEASLRQMIQRSFE